MEPEEIVELMRKADGKRIPGIRKLTLLVNPHVDRERSDEIRRLFYSTMDYKSLNLGMTEGPYQLLIHFENREMDWEYGPNYVKERLERLLKHSIPGRGLK